MKKAISVFMALAMMVSLFTACSGDSQSSGGSSQSTGGESSSSQTSSSETVNDQTGGGEKTELVIWHGFSSASTKPAVEGTFDKFNEAQSDIHVTYEMLPRNDLLKQYTLGVVSGNLPDLGTADNPDYSSLAAIGVFSDITDWFNSWDQKDVFLEDVMASCYYQDKLYGLPFAPNCIGLWCNQAMLDEAGIEAPPATYEELEEAAAKLTKDGVYGFALSAIKTEEGTFQHLPFVMSAGGNILDLSSEESKTGLRTLGRMFENGYISQEALNWTQSDVLQQFMAGNVAMIISGNWNLTTIHSEVPDLEFTISPIPKAEGGNNVTILGGEAIGVTSTTEHPDQALQFLEWFLSKDVNAELVKQCTRFSPRSDITAEDLYPGDEELAIYVELMQDAKPRGPHPKWTEISNVFQVAFQEAWTQTKDIDTAMDEAAQKIAEIDATTK